MGSNKEMLNYLKQKSEANRQIAFDIKWKIENNIPLSIECEDEI